MKLTLEEPVLNISIDNVSNPDPESTYRFNQECRIAHVPSQQYKDYKSVHRLDISWEFVILDPKKETIFKCDINHSCILLYKHDPQVREKIEEMLIVAHSWVALAMNREKGFPLPPLQIDETWINETSELLLASDAP